MKFFNKKQDVLDIQLTSYGKRKLSQGKFKPYCYCFFDDSVIYDGDYINIAEVQNKIEERILQNTEYLKTNPVALGAETRLRDGIQQTFEADSVNLDQNKIKEYYGDSLQNAADRNTICKYKLGNSQLGSQEAPKFILNSAGVSFKTVRGGIVDEQLSAPFSHYSGSSIIQEIPQLEVPLVYEIVEKSYDLLTERTEQQLYIYPEDFPVDDGVIECNGDYLAIDLKEYNTDYLKENFEYEIYEVIPNSNTGSMGTAATCVLDFKICPPDGTSMFMSNAGGQALHVIFDWNRSTYTNLSKVTDDYRVTIRIGMLGSSKTAASAAIRFRYAMATTRHTGFSASRSGTTVTVTQNKNGYSGNRRVSVHSDPDGNYINTSVFGKHLIYFTGGISQVQEQLIPLQLTNMSGLATEDPADSFAQNYIEVLTDTEIPPVFRNLLNLDDQANNNLNTFGDSSSEDTGSAAGSQGQTTPYTGNDQAPEDPGDC